MRHLQTPAGQQDPDLTEEGRRSAGLLDSWFQRDPPDAIYASNTRRAQQTAAPLAARLHINPKIYDPSDTAALVASVLRENGTVLIVGHSNTVPGIVAAIGGERPADLTHEDFGDIWHVFGEPRKTVRRKLAP